MNTLCISKSWLRQKSLELGIKDSAIESIVHKYINQLGNNNFPTDDYIKQLFIPKSQLVDDEDYFNNLIKIYNNIGGENTYNGEEEAIIALNRALKVFDENSVTLMPTNDGKYIVRIAEPINKNYKKELLDILAKAPRDSQGRLLAPNGKISNLTERQYALVRTKAFKRWFGDWENNPENSSKVVDENGEPLVVYHGNKYSTPITKFKKGFKNTFNTSREGYYFTDNIEDAEYFADTEGYSKIAEKQKEYLDNVTNNYKVIYNIENSGKDVVEFYDTDGGPLYVSLKSDDKTSIIEAIKESKEYKQALDDYNRYLEFANSNGQILSVFLNIRDTKNIRDYNIYGTDAHQYIADNPNQIKSATDNIGAFSKEDDNINNNQIDFFEDNTDVRKKPQIKDNIEKGKDYTIDKLIELFNKYSIDKEQQELAKKVFAVAKKLNFKVLFLVDNLGWNIAGLQDYDVLKIARITTLEQNKNKLADVLLHETIHGVTTYAINAYKNGELKDKKLIEAVEELQNVYDSILDNESIKDEYGLTNVKELVAELANPSFRDKLKKISIWEKLKNAIKKIFFFFSESDVSAHTVLSDALDKFLDNYDVNLWNSYNITPDTKINDFNFDIINNQQKQSLTRFSTSESSSYPERTKENADWSDITLDFTESDKGSGGRNELTKKVAGKKYIHFKLHSEGDNSYDADEILDAIKQAGLPTKNIKLNIAGSEIGKLKETQEIYNEEIERILNDLLTLGITISEIRTGGLTGIDEAGIIAALRLGIPNEVHATSDYKFRDKSGKDIPNELAFKARFLQLPLTLLHTIKESVGYKKMNVVLQDLINKIDESGIKSAKAARNLYDWTIQANNAILDAINKGERKDELINLDNLLDTLNRMALHTPKELGEKAIKAIKELSKDFGIQQQTLSLTLQHQGEKVSDKNTYKGKKKDEEPKIEFANNTLKKTYDNFVEKQRELSTIIKFNPKNHSYLIDGVMADFSVTEYKTFALTGKRPKKETNFWFEVSGRLGTSHDEMLRDFFGKGLKDFYTNVSSKQVESFKIQALKFKEELLNEFGRDAIFITDEDLLRVAATINNDGNNFLVAGTMDMIVIDNKGVLHIVDFKTKRANLGKDLDEKTIKGYNRQVNLYKHLLASTLGPNVKIGTTRIGQFNVKYTADDNNKYTYEGNQVKYKGKPIQYYSSRKDSKGDFIYEVGQFYDTIEFKEDFSEEIFDEILPAKTKVLLLKETHAYHEKYGNTYDDSFEEWDDEVTDALKELKESKDLRKGSLGQLINEKLNEIEKLTKLLEELNKKFDKLLGEKKKDDKKDKKDDNKSSKGEKKKADFEVSHPLIKSLTFTRDSAKKDIKTLYIFTDNTNRDSGSEVIPDDSWYALKYGKGLHYPTRTAAVVRGLDNARPVSTQRYYKKGEDYKKNRWFDKDIEEFKKVIDAEFEDIFEAWKSGSYDRIVIPDGGGFFNTGISNISKDRVPEIEAYLESKIQELYKVLDESIEEKKEAKRKEIQEKLKYKRVELLQIQQKLKEFADDFYHLELQEEKGNYTALYTLSMDKFLTGKIDEGGQLSETIITKEKKLKVLKELTLCMPLSSLLTIDTTYVNYNLLFTLDELLRNEALFPKGPSQENQNITEVQLSEDLRPIAETMKRQNKKFPYNSKTGILQIPQFTVGYTDTEIVKRNLRNKLLNNDLISLSQLRVLAKATVYKVSEIITKIHDNLNGYTYYFGRTEGDPNIDKDFTLMSRIEIIQTIGLGRLFNLVKEGREGVFNIDNFDSMNTPLELFEKIDFIVLNWDAFIDLGYDTLINLEEIALDDNNSTASLKSDIDNLFEDNDESIVQELFGSSIEHWQVGFRLVSAINSMSKQLKIVLDSFYQVDEAGDIITDDLGIGIGKHLNALEAAAKILYYTLGARSIEDMIKLLKAQLDVEPWLYQLMPYIEDLYDREGKLISKADETFKSQFYSNFKKYFQKYAITFKKGNKIQTKIINESSYTDSLMDSSKALENSATLGKFNLKTKENKLNKEAFKKLKELSTNIANFASTASKVRGVIEDNPNFNLDKFHNLIYEIYNLLNIDTPTKETFYKIFSVKNNINVLSNKLSFLISEIEKNRDKIDDGSKTITSIKDYKDIANIVGKYMGLEMESVTYEAGKMYYSYVLPSYLGRLVSKLKGENLSSEEYADVLEKEYLQYPLFRRDKRIRCYWLERLKASKEVRNMFQHIVSLHYLGVEYTNKTPVEYIASMMRAYFYDDNKNWAYYRVPTLSNKPSEEYLRFIRIHNGYENTIVEKLYDTFSYELDRILAVRERRDNLSEDRKIKNFDSFVLKDKAGNVKIKKGNGEKFVFLDWVLPYLDGSFKNTKEYKLLKKQAKESEDALKLLEKMLEFSSLINKKLDNKMSNENADNAKLLELFKDIAKVSIEQKYQEARQYWEREGFLTRKTVEKNGKKTETIEIFGFGKGSNLELTLEDLREFFFNDMFAAINILQLTVGDTAYYKDTEDLQKRLALIHAPGMQANILAKDSEGNRYSDGFERTMYISDEIIKSELIPNLKVAMNTILSEYDKNSKQYAILKNQFKFILDTAKKINVADALGFSCLTSHRKKLALFGLWTDRMEEAYLLLTLPELFDEDASLNDILDVLLLPIKPFVYTLIPKNGYSTSLPKLKVGVQNKNSEYVIALVGAILKRGNLPNKLRAIYQFMEDSQKNGKGIDTILFESTVKAGLTGVINLNGNMSEEDIYNVLLSHLYNKEGDYNIDYVHVIPFEDYIIQQNVPSHFRDHQLAHGSQNRILTVADLLDVDAEGNTNYITIDGKRVTVKEAKENYFNAIADNIRLSVNLVIKRFNLDSIDKRQRNIALSRILKDAILKDSRFGADLYWACDTNEYGEFNIPLSDPIHSTRIQQLLNSIIKNAINKLEIAGGPVVLATSWGLSDELHIRFKSYDDRILLTEEEFETENYPTDYETGNYLPKGDYTSYEDYVKDNQDCVAYFECYVPIQDLNIALDFTRKDDEGNEYIDIEAMKEANPKLLEMISYRIPTESKYSMVPIKVKGFVNNMSGELIMMPKEITWLSGSDFDVDKQYIMRYLLERVEHEDGTVTYEMPKSGKAYNDNLIISTLLAILESEHTTRQLFTPGNFEEPKRLGYTIEYVQSKIREAKELGEDYSIQELYSEAATMSNDELKDAVKTRSNLIYNNVLSLFHKQNMVAGQLIGIFALANVSHAFLGLVNNTALLLGNSGIEFTIDGTYVGGEYLIDNIYSNDGITYQSSILASLLAASVDAVKDPILNLANINLDTANIVTSMVRMGFSLELTVLLLNQPIIQLLVRDLGIENANNKNEGKTYHKDLSRIIGETIELLELSKEELKDLQEIKITSEALINNLDGSDDITSYMAIRIISDILNISSSFSNIQHMTRYNSISSAVGPTATDTMLNRIKDEIFMKDDLLNPNIIEACGVPVRKESGEEVYNPILYWFREGANTLERAILGENLILADEDFFTSLKRVGNACGFKKGLPDDVARKFADFYMSYYVNTNPTGTVFDLSKERREFMIKEFPLYFQEIKSKYSENPFILAIILKTASTEEYPFLQLKTRGLGSEDIEDLKQGWATLFLNGGEDADLAIALVEYNFFRGGFGFSPKTFTNLIPNVIKYNLPNYLNTLNTKRSSMNSENPESKPWVQYRMLVLFLLHNPEIIRDKYYDMSLYNPLIQEDGNIIIDVMPDFSKSKSKYPPKIIGEFLPTGWIIRTPIIIIDGKAYYVNKLSAEGVTDNVLITIIPTDFLGGNGLGIEMDVNKMLIKSIYNLPKVKNNNTMENNKVLNEEEIKILMANLFENEEFSPMINAPSKGKNIAVPIIDLINKALSDKSINYSLHQSNKNRNTVIRVMDIIKDALKNKEDIKEVLNSTNKTLDDLNLCS